MRDWRAMLQVGRSSALLLVTDETSDVLKARLPLSPSHPRALLTLLEGTVAVVQRAAARCRFCQRPLSGLGRVGAVRGRVVSRREPARSLSRRAPRQPRAAPPRDR